MIYFKWQNVRFVFLTLLIWQSEYSSHDVELESEPFGTEKRKSKVQKL